MTECNNLIASRLVGIVDSIVAIAIHMKDRGVDAAPAIRTLVCNSVKMMDKAKELAVRVESLQTKQEILELVDSCRCDKNKKRDAVAASL